MIIEIIVILSLILGFIGLIIGAFLAEIEKRKCIRDKIDYKEDIIFINYMGDCCLFGFFSFFIIPGIVIFYLGKLFYLYIIVKSVDYLEGILK